MWLKLAIHIVLLCLNSQSIKQLSAAAKKSIDDVPRLHATFDHAQQTAESMQRWLRTSCWNNAGNVEVMLRAAITMLGTIVMLTYLHAQDFQSIIMMMDYETMLSLSWICFTRRLATLVMHVLMTDNCTVKLESNGFENLIVVVHLMLVASRHYQLSVALSLLI